MKDRSDEKDDDEKLVGSPEEEIILKPEKLEETKPAILLSPEKKKIDLISITSLKKSEDIVVETEETPPIKSGSGKLLSLPKRKPSVKIVPTTKPSQNTGKSITTGKVISGWI